MSPNSDFLTEVQHPTLANRWFVESIGTLSSKICNTLRNNATRMHLGAIRDDSITLGVSPYKLTLVFDDALDGTVSNAVNTLVSANHIGLVRIGLGAPNAPANYFNFTGCRVTKYDFSLDYADNNVAKHIIQIQFDSYERTID